MLHRQGECHALLPENVKTRAQDLQVVLHRWAGAPLQQLIVLAILLASSMVHPRTLRFGAAAKQTSCTHSAFCCWGVHRMCQRITFKNTFVVWKHKSRLVAHLSCLKSFTSIMITVRGVLSKRFVNEVTGSRTGSEASPAELWWDFFWYGSGLGEPGNTKLICLKQVI